MHVITNDMVHIRQLFSRIAILLSSMVSVAFSTSYSHDKTNLPIRRFLHEQFLISKYSPVLHALLPLQSHVLGFHV